jgi:hypothetical protein
MARNEAPPFNRGEYSSQSGMDHLVGKTWLFEDLDLTTSATNTGAKKHRTGKMVECMLVKNGSGGALLPKRLVTFKTSSGPDYVGVVDGYARTTADRGYPVDEFLPAAGVPDGGYFFIVVKGPATVITPLAGSEFNGDVSVGSVLVALTAATSGATTAGRVAVQNITGSSQATDYTFIFNQIQNAVGRALSAKTTGNTNADLFLDVKGF